MRKTRVFGECLMAMAVIALSLYVGYAAIGTVASRAMLASLN